MKCPLCGKDVILQQKQVGTNENGEPIMNQYAICKDCKKQWNLDKQRAKKMAAKKAVEDAKQAEPTRSGEEKNAVKKSRPVNGEDAPRKRRPVNEDGTPKKHRTTDEEATPKKRRPVNEDGTPKKRRPVNEDGTPKKRRTADGEATPKKRRPVNEDGTPKKRRTADGEAAPKKRRPIEEEAALSSASETTEEQKYSNIPPQHVRAKREHAMRKGYEDMLSTDPSYKSNKISNTDDLSDLKQRTMNAYDDMNDDDDWDDEYEPKARFRVLRVLLGILSIGGFGFCVYSALMAGLDGILSGDTASAGMTYAILAACMFVSALLLLIMQKSNSVFAFILPMILYLGGGVYAFMKRQGEANLLYCAIAGLVLAVIFLILTIASRGDSDDYDPSDDYDDPFEDDFDN